MHSFDSVEEGSRRDDEVNGTKVGEVHGRIYFTCVPIPLAYEWLVVLDGVDEAVYVFEG